MNSNPAKKRLSSKHYFSHIIKLDSPLIVI
jgi:hypothetical protein